MLTRKPVLLVLAALILSLACPLDLSAQDKRLGKHTIAEWHAIIDSTWGAGLPTETKLTIFDFFWNEVDREYGGFPNLNINWDSLKAYYRPQVASGVSRGRFAAIIGQLSLALQEVHSWMYDVGIDSATTIPGGYSLSGTNSVDYVYRPGRPLFWPSGWGPCGVFGAALTPLPDSSLLVYKAIDGHPLGLVPGDVVLGYNRVPWKRLYREILSAEFPLGWGMGHWGSSTRSMTHSLLTSAGHNWGLFDTVDVVKYATGDTIHLATQPLTGLRWDTLFASEQLPVPGVPMPTFWDQRPNIENGPFVSYGVVNGTSIGYVYVYRWNVVDEPLFTAAIHDLLQVKKVTGLILDFRYNLGSTSGLTGIDHGLDHLFRENPAGSLRWRAAARNTAGGHFSFNYSTPFDQTIVIQPDYYDRPIAVLTGPAAWSFGDLNPFRMRFHPMVRIFGLPTSGAFAMPHAWETTPRWGSWYHGCVPGQMESLVNGEGFLMHKGYPVDEELWLTREGVVKGEDDVVKRALAWITTLTHGHTTRLDQPYARPGLDSVTVRALLANPESHAVRLSAVLTGSLEIAPDSVLLFNDGVHGDGAAGDSLWGARLLAPTVEGFFDLSLKTEDLSGGTSRRLPKVVQLTTAGPVRCLGDTLASAKKAWGQKLRLRLNVVNSGSTAPIPAVSGTIRSLDTAATVLSGSPFLVGELLPGSPVISSGVALSFAAGQKGPRQVPFEILFASGDFDFWRDTLWLQVGTTGVVATEAQLPQVYQLQQNYPNPFNPVTTIRYSLPHRAQVTLTVLNILGQQVAELVHSTVDAGHHEVRFNASSLGSGVYFYRLQTGSFTDTKRLVILK